MRNELLLILELVILYGGCLLWFRLFGTKGLHCLNAIATIVANIEVVVLIEAFGMEQTLGNIPFALTFLITDILSETAGKKEANRSVNIGIASSCTFLVLTQLWLRFIPSPNDAAFPGIQMLFTDLPRIMIASFVVYAIVQKADVALYHAIWDSTEKRSGNRKAYLWLRNNGSTLISQFLNAVLFNLGAFAGVYPWKSLLGIIFSTYAIYIATSLLDTPVVYLARKIAKGDRRS